jgi:hypothetical protein
VGEQVTRAAMWMLLVVVAAAAAVLSFSALRDLAALCGFAERLAWLLPVVIDAGAAAGCIVWLGIGRSSRAARFARSLTFVLLGSSVAGNAVVHGLTAYRLLPPWWLVVAVSAVAPAVLGAVVHLAVLVGRGTQDPRTPDPHWAETNADLTRVEHRSAVDVGSTDAQDQGSTPVVPAGWGRRRVAKELAISEHAARQLLAQRNGAAR